ncbi:kelch-like 31 [Plakobranchus ocellatus]|uniref:Kelch-like 31 n=1 Tax=Plakobranchus ocellatus TaxID=259542 RepID=A0AAV4DF58_9GAST|nr:kelch-like 31 [Plakobranchus ocellatus]
MVCGAVVRSKCLASCSSSRGNIIGNRCASQTRLAWTFYRDMDTIAIHGVGCHNLSVLKRVFTAVGFNIGDGFRDEIQYDCNDDCDGHKMHPVLCCLENCNSGRGYADSSSDCQDDENCNNNGIGDYNNSKRFGTTPLTALKFNGNQWTLVPCSTLDYNANKEPPYVDRPECLGMGKGIYLETSHIDFLMCMALSGQSKDELLSRCEAALLAADVNNVTESYLIAAKYGLRRVMDSLIQLIRDNFIYVTQTRQFLELPVDLVELFLSDTFVNVGDELDVFSCALRWIDYNKQERICQSGRVLNCVRYERIRPIDIRDHIEPNIHLFNGPCGPEALVNIYRTHALAYAGVEYGSPLGPRVTPETFSAPNQQENPASSKTPPKKGAGTHAKGKPGTKQTKTAKRNKSSNKPVVHSSGANVRWKNRSSSNSGRVQSLYDPGSRQSYGKVRLGRKAEAWLDDHEHLHRKQSRGRSKQRTPKPGRSLSSGRGSSPLLSCVSVHSELMGFVDTASPPSDDLGTITAVDIPGSPLRVLSVLIGRCDSCLL